MAYSYTHRGRGGVAEVRLSEHGARLTPSRSLFDRNNCREPLKVRRSPQGDWILCTDVSPRDQKLYLWTETRPRSLLTLGLKAIPDEARFFNQLAIVTCDDNSVVFVSVPEGTIARRDNAEKSLSPPGSGPEDIHVVANSTVAVVTFQKDSRTGAKQGNRLVLYDLNSLRPVADLVLPRDRPELHLNGNPKEQGPGPEVVQVASQHNLMIVTLDLYGAVGFANWEAAQRGELADWQIVSTALDDSWGSAFPDRMTMLEWQGIPYVLVTNAGTEGGTVLIDLRTRKVVGKALTPPGLEAPVVVTSLGKAYSVCSGKTKQRGLREVIKRDSPQRLLFVLDLALMASGADARRTVSTHPLPGSSSQIGLLRAEPAALLIACDDQDPETDQLILFDPKLDKIIDRQPAAGNVARFER